MFAVAKWVVVVVGVGRRCLSVAWVVVVWWWCGVVFAAVMMAGVVGRWCDN
jgi:hypothetical protein